MNINVKIKALPGHTAEEFEPGSSVLVMNDANNSRNVIVDIDAVRAVLGDLADGRADSAAHYGFGEFWTLVVA